MQVPGNSYLKMTFGAAKLFFRMLLNLYHFFTSFLKLYKEGDLKVCVSPREEFQRVTIVARQVQIQKRVRGWSGPREKKIQHKINSIQLAECSLLLARQYFTSVSPATRGREGSFSKGGCATMEPFTQPLAPSQHPYIIIHTGKKPGGTYAMVYDGGAFENFKVPENWKLEVETGGCG
ncbi:uncharacterized protein LOC143183150 [Calliopsis andreniformis]|uniref:uncharacterized protein LOC143183150 n=1 Tax=Calliopsis andreniformis TaxID=337506 RepID=UPI003FCDD2BA